jgi:hypothetical protein
MYSMDSAKSTPTKRELAAIAEAEAERHATIEAKEAYITLDSRYSTIANG